MMRVKSSVDRLDKIKNVRCTMVNTQLKQLNSNEQGIKQKLTLETGLDTLNSYSTTDEQKILFYHFFREAIISAKERYEISKKKAWSPIKNFFVDCCTALIPIVSGLLLFWFSEDNALTTGTVSLIVGILFAVAWFLMRRYQEAQKRRSYSETWVRHSVCYGRLHLTLQRYVISKHTEDDYVRLVDDTFAILEQNYDQFAANLSTNGVAPRRNS